MEFNKLVNDFKPKFAIARDNFAIEKKEKLKTAWTSQDKIGIEIGEKARKNLWFGYIIGYHQPFDIKDEKRASWTYKYIACYTAVYIGEYSFFEGRLLGYDEYGNISYGAWGKQMVWGLQHLIDAASIAQRGNNAVYGREIAGDPPRDHLMISIGFKK
jgi:hypothetical protein